MVNVEFGEFIWAIGAASAVMEGTGQDGQVGQWHAVRLGVTNPVHEPNKNRRVGRRDGHARAVTSEQERRLPIRQRPAWLHRGRLHVRVTQILANGRRQTHRRARLLDDGPETKCERLVVIQDDGLVPRWHEQRGCTFARDVNDGASLGVGCCVQANRTKQGRRRHVRRAGEDAGALTGHQGDDLCMDVISRLIAQESPRRPTLAEDGQEPTSIDAGVLSDVDVERCRAAAVDDRA